MLFSHLSGETTNVPLILTSQGNVIELVKSYKYLGFILECDLSFKSHIANLASKLKVKLGFYYRNKSCFSLRARKLLVSSSFLPLLDYGDVLYMGSSAKCLQSLCITVR